MRTAGLWLLGCALASAAHGQVDDPSRWYRFRGANGNGVSPDDDPPVTFGPEERLLWKLPAPPGHSSPIVWDDLIFLTGVADDGLATPAIAEHTLYVRTADDLRKFGDPVASTALPPAFGARAAR